MDPPIRVFSHVYCLQSVTISHNCSLLFKVLDNAAYHGRNSDGTPCSKTKKADLKQWLNDHNVPFPAKALRKELWTIVKREVQTNPKKRVDSLLRQHGHTPLRLPPYHWFVKPAKHCLFLDSLIPFGRRIHLCRFCFCL